VSVVYGTTANVAGVAIRNFTNRPVTFESNRDVWFESWSFAGP